MQVESNLELLRKQLSFPTIPTTKQTYLHLLAFAIVKLECSCEWFDLFRWWLLPTFHLTYIKPYPYYKPFHLAIVNYASGLSSMLKATGRFAWGLTIEEQEQVVQLLEKHYGYVRPR